VWVGVKNHFPMILKVFTGISLMKNYNFLMHVFFMHGLSSESVEIPWFDSVFADTDVEIKVHDT
jgi:hypothetical protein